MRVRVLAALVAALGATSAAAQEAALPRFFVSPAALATELRGPAAPLLLDVGRPLATYDSAHVAGARHVQLVDVAIEKDGIAYELPGADTLRALFGGLGVDGTRPVVLYGEPLATARAFVALDWLGLADRVRVLDGGLEAWRAAGLPLTFGAEPARRATLAAGPRADLLVDAAWVNARRGDPAHAIIDARPLLEYTGATPGTGIARPGHIPGSPWLFWRRLLVEGTTRLRPEAELRRLFEEAGAARGDTVVAYCRTGMQASWLYLVARALGYETRLYDGSYVDWARSPDRPTRAGRVP